MSDSMESKELLREVSDALRSNAEFCSMYSAWDIGDCLLADLNDCKLIIPQEQLEEMVGMANYYIRKLRQLFAEKNNIEAANTVDYMIDLLEDIPDKSFVEKTSYDITLEEHRQKKTIIVIGDSHASFFSGNELPTYVSIGGGINVCPNVGDRPFTVLHLGPCLAYNSCKHGTHNRFLEKSEWLFDNFFDKKETVIVSLGEIDMRAHVFKEVEKQGRPYEDIVRDIVGNYGNFLSKLKSMGHDVYCWGPIAAEKDIYPRYPELFPRYGTEVERNTATELFTTELNDYCDNYGMKLMSIFKYMVDADKNSDDSFFSSDHWHLTQGVKDIAEQIWKESGLL